MLAINLDYNPRITLAGFVDYTSPWQHFRRISDEYILYVMRTGELILEEAGVMYALRSGDALFLEPGKEHVGMKKSKCSYFFIHFKHPDLKEQEAERFGSVMDELLDDGGDHGDGADRLVRVPKHFLMEEKAILSQIEQGLNELLQLHRRKQFNRSLTGLKLSELFVQLSRGYVHQERSRKQGSVLGLRKAYDLLDYIHHHYAAPLTGREIEIRFDCNFDHMNRMFRKLTGHSIMHYLNRVRVRHAQELIRATRLSMGEITHLVGFQDLYYFSRVFKKYIGISPTGYSKRLVAEESAGVTQVLRNRLPEF